MAEDSRQLDVSTQDPTPEGGSITVSSPDQADSTRFSQRVTVSPVDAPSLEMQPESYLDELPEEYQTAISSDTRELLSNVKVIGDFASPRVPCDLIEEQVYTGEPSPVPGGADGEMTPVQEQQREGAFTVDAQTDDVEILFINGEWDESETPDAADPSSTATIIPEIPITMEDFEETEDEQALEKRFLWGGAGMPEDEDQDEPESEQTRPYPRPFLKHIHLLPLFQKSAFCREYESKARWNKLALNILGGGRDREKPGALFFEYWQRFIHALPQHLLEKKEKTDDAQEAPAPDPNTDPDPEK